MGWFILKHIFSTILSIINITRLSNQEKNLEILILRQQLSILQRNHHFPIHPDRVEKITFYSWFLRLRFLNHTRSYYRTSGFSGCCSILSILYFFVHSIQKERILPIHIVQSGRSVLSWLAYLKHTWESVSSSFHEKTPVFQGFFCEREEIRTLNLRLKRPLLCRWATRPAY